MTATSKRVTVEDASPSPPSLPKEPPPTSKPAEPIDQPIDSLGDEGSEEEEEDEGDESEDEWDPSAERGPGQVDGHAKGKGKEQANGEAQPWQAVWAPEQNAWYFWNANTGEVTWTNPLDPTPSAPATTTNPAPTPAAPFQPPLPTGPPPSSSRSHDPTFGLPPDIDPDLAHLLPPDQRGMAQMDQGSQKALFNARTGRFTPADYAYSVDHLDEYNRAKRMSSHYFDVEAWEREKAEENAKRKRDEEMGISSKKKITKKDMDRFRKKQQERKHRSQAWLRD